MTDDVLAVLALDTDYSDSPLWHDGMLDRDHLPLTEGTWAALKEWARYYNDHHDGSGNWTPGSQRLPYLERGNRLAAQVAAEIGHNFAVKHGGLTFRSETAATNPAAAEALHEMIRFDTELDRRSEDGRQRGITFGWRWFPQTERFGLVG